MTKHISQLQERSLVDYASSRWMADILTLGGYPFITKVCA